MADKIPTITKSALFNGGKQTVLTSILSPGATTFPHYHTQFTETFTLISGSLTIYMSPEDNMNPKSLQLLPLNIGESFTVPIGRLHKFLAGDQGCTSTVTFEPGTLDFERAMLIMRGTQQDGSYQPFGHGPDEKNGMLMAVLAELTDSNGVGDDKAMLDKLHETSEEEYAALKASLLSKYATDEHLNKSTAN